jgi:hypothetical protein
MIWRFGDLEIWKFEDSNYKFTTNTGIFNS